MKHNYTEWAYQMWEENCEERESFGEEHLSYNEYMRDYKEFLSKEYIKEKDKERDADI